MKDYRGLCVLAIGSLVSAVTPAGAQAFTNAFVLVQAQHAAGFESQQIPITFKNTPDLPASLIFGASPNVALPVIGPQFSVSSVITADHNGTVSAYAAGANEYVHGPEAVSGTGGGTQAQAILTYSFRVVGPASPGPIGVHTIADGFAKSGGAGGASVSLFLDAELLGSARSQYGDGGTQSFHFDDTLLLSANTDYVVKMTAVADASDFPIVAGDPREHLAAGFGDAFIDPSFIIDPEFASTYHIVGLPTAVPLPASIWLFASVGGGIFAFRRRRETAHRIAGN